MNIKNEVPDISFFVSGPVNATPIVFIHGFPFNREMWQPQVEFLEKSYRVITYDLRGHGKSTVGDGQYFMEYFVDDFITLLNHLKIASAVICGFSMGGYIALRAIERYPEKFKGLILADTRSEADSNEAKLKRAAGLMAIKSQGMALFAEGFLKMALAPETFK